MMTLPNSLVSLAVRGRCSAIFCANVSFSVDMPSLLYDENMMKKPIGGISGLPKLTDRPFWGAGPLRQRRPAHPSCADYDPRRCLIKTRRTSNTARIRALSPTTTESVAIDELAGFRGFCRVFDGGLHSPTISHWSSGYLSFMTESVKSQVAGCRLQRALILSLSKDACSALSALIIMFAAATACVQAAAPAFDSNRAWEHLRQLVAIGPRPAGSAAK